MKARSGEKMKLTSIEELLGVPNEEMATEIEIDKIMGFENHPFKVVDDDKMTDLVESIRVNGVLTPVLIRPVDEDRYEMISGHRRMHAAKAAGLQMIPAIIREMNTDDAIITMVDANIQREELLPSEKAFAFKMKMDAMKRQGERQDLTSRQIGEKLTCDLIGDDSGVSGRQVQRYIRLTKLIPDLLDLVDQKRLQFTVAVEISYIEPEIQQWINEYIRENGAIKGEQIAVLRNYLQIGPVTQNQMIDIFNNSQKGNKPSKKITFSEKKLRNYFPPFYSTEDMEQVMMQLLEEWKIRQNETSEEEYTYEI